jgi:hypothetical protein
LHVDASACPPAAGPHTGTAAACLPTGTAAAGTPTGTAATGLVAGPAAGTVAAWSAVLADVVEAKPDLVLVSTGAEAREGILTALRVALPGAWLVDCAGIIDGLVHGRSARLRRWPFHWLPRRGRS